MRRTLPTFLIIAMLSVVSCTPNPASALASQLSRGQAIYEQGCATESCHGKNGEGIPGGHDFRVWPLLGKDFQQRNPTAQVIFDVVRSGGESSLRALTDQQIYDSIAYELSLNQVELPEPLTSQNASQASSGPDAGDQLPGSLFPPPGNSQVISDWEAPTLPAESENDELRIRLTQIARTISIGGMVPSNEGSYVLIVFTLEDLTDQPLEVGPGHLTLLTQDEQILAPLEITLEYPVSRFHDQKIQPEHGASALAIFALPEDVQISHLSYTSPSGQSLILELSS